MHIRLRSKRKGDHVHTRVFMGEDLDHLALCGTLVLYVGEWQIFGAALSMEAKETLGQLTFDAPDQNDVVNL